jgi:hypothetical protein
MPREIHRYENPKRGNKTNTEKRRRSVDYLILREDFLDSSNQTPLFRNQNQNGKWEKEIRLFVTSHISKLEIDLTVEEGFLIACQFCLESLFDEGANY